MTVKPNQSGPDVASPNLKPVKRVAMHSVVVATRAVLREGSAEIDRRTGLIRRRRALLNIHVSKKCLARAIEAANLIIRLAEANGVTVEVVEEEYRPPVVYLVMGQFRLAFTLREKTTELPKPEKKPKRRTSTGLTLSNLLEERQRYEPSGRLYLRFDNVDWTRVKRRWNESAGRTLVDQAEEVVAGLLNVFRVMREHAERWKREQEEAHARRREHDLEAEATRRLEQQLADLTAMANEHEQAVRIRRLVTAARAHGSSGRIVPEFLDWAERVAEAKDPITAVGGLVERMAAGWWVDPRREG